MHTWLFLGPGDPACHLAGLARTVIAAAMAAVAAIAERTMTKLRMTTALDWSQAYAHAPQCAMAESCQHLQQWASQTYARRGVGTDRMGRVV
jgi:hypothetical protein